MRLPDGPIGPDYLAGALARFYDAYERNYILRKLAECDGNITRAAEALGIDRSHLYRRMKALGISDKRLGGVG